MTEPCPFCGATPYVEQSRACCYRVRCVCGYFSPCASSEEVARRVWDDYVRALDMVRASLKPCPFCGCSVSLDIGVYGDGEDLFQVVHPENDCILSEVVSWSSTLDEVVPAWNSRVKEGGS